jgi:hypothetical protein
LRKCSYWVTLSTFMEESDDEVDLGESIIIELPSRKVTGISEVKGEYNLGSCEII